MNDPRCPGCGSRAFEQVSKERVWPCASCGGAWLDNEACARLLALALSGEVLDAVRRAETSDEATGYRERSRPTKRSCPECDQELDRADHHGVRLDICHAHGTYFDEGELATLHDRLRARKDALDESAVLEMKQELAEARRRDAAKEGGHLLVDIIDMIFRL